MWKKQEICWPINLEVVSNALKELNWLCCSVGSNAELQNSYVMPNAKHDISAVI